MTLSHLLLDLYSPVELIGYNFDIEELVKKYLSKDSYRYPGQGIKGLNEISYFKLLSIANSKYSDRPSGKLPFEHRREDLQKRRNWDRIYKKEGSSKAYYNEFDTYILETKHIINTSRRRDIKSLYVAWNTGMDVLNFKKIHNLEWSDLLDYEEDKDQIIKFFSALKKYGKKDVVSGIKYDIIHTLDRYLGRMINFFQYKKSLESFRFYVNIHNLLWPDEQLNDYYFYKKVQTSAGHKNLLNMYKGYSRLPSLTSGKTFKDFEDEMLNHSSSYDFLVNTYVHTFLARSTDFENEEDYKFLFLYKYLEKSFELKDELEVLFTMSMALKRIPWDIPFMVMSNLKKKVKPFGVILI